MTQHTINRITSLTPSSFLRSLRNANSYKASEIHKCVVSYAQELNPDLASPDNPASYAAAYREVLKEMGYEFQPAGLDPNFEYPEKTLLTFQTRYLCLENGGLRNAAASRQYRAHAKIVQSALQEAGFKRMFFAVLFANNPEKAILRVFPRANPAQYVKWYYLTRHARNKVDFPQGCMFFYGHSRFPCLILGKPSFTDPSKVEHALRVRIIHEIAHYYHTFTLFLDGEYPVAERIFQLTGEMITAFVWGLIGECFAHTETLRIFHEEYLRYAPHTSQPVTPRPKQDNIPKNLHRWLRATRREYFKTLRFLDVFPWICATAVYAESKCDSLFEILESPFAELAVKLLLPMLSIYGHGELRTPDILEIVQQIEQSGEALAHISAYSAMNEIITEEAFAPDHDPVHDFCFK